MTFGYNKRIYTESRMNLDDRNELPVAYTRYMTVALAYAKKHTAFAMIGLGGGRTSQYLHQFMPGADIDVVELDPDVIALARKHFHLQEGSRYRIHAADGFDHQPETEKSSKPRGQRPASKVSPPNSSR